MSDLAHNHNTRLRACSCDQVVASYNCHGMNLQTAVGMLT